MFKHLRFKIAAMWFLQAALAFVAFAQVDRATLEGTVTDPSGAAVAGAQVKISAVETGLTQERTTNNNGYYRFPGIAIGDYTVFVTYKGFKTKAIEDVRVQVGQTRTLDVALEIGAASDKIEVQVQLTPAERSSAESSAVIGTDQIENLPLNGRNWANLTRLAPWAQDDGGGDQRTIRFAGRGRDDNTFSYDGIDATGIQEQAQKAEVRLQISPDAIEEYRVSSALYDAEYGSQAGGQVDVVTKSGTNDYHGSLYGYFRNSAFDARNFNDPLTGVPPFRMGQYGLTFGGPIVKTKAFFFMNYEGLRQYQEVSLSAAVPDLPVQQAALLNNPQSANLCPIFQAYPWRQSSVAALQGSGCTPHFVYPDAAFTPGVCTDSMSNPIPCDITNSFDNFAHGGKSIIHEDTWLARFDYKFSEATTFYARVQRDVALARSPNGNLFDQNDTNNHPANYILALQHFFGPNLLNEFKFGVNRAPFHNPVLPGFLDVNLVTANFEQLNNSQADNEVGTTWSYVDNMTWTHGRHTVKAGIEVKRVQLNQGKTAALVVSLKGGTSDNTSLINNQVDSVDYTSSWDGHALRRTFVMPYIQDEWKVKPNLTVNAGLRWDYYAPITEAHDRVKIFDLQNCNGVCPPTSALEYPNYKNFDPRVSVAWAPKRFNEKTVVRAGFGIYHGSAQNDDRNAALESDRTDNNFAVSQNGLTQAQLFFQPGYLQKPPDFNLPGGSALGAAIARALIRHHPDLYVETWGLSVQQAIPWNFLFTASYLGSHGVHIFTRNYENLCNPAILHPDPLPGQMPVPNCVRPLDNFPDPVSKQTFGDIDYKANQGQSYYDGLLLALDRPITRGWSVTAKYTLSHSLNWSTIGGGEAIAPQNAQCLACEKGPSIYDVRHNIVLANIYQLPFGEGKTYFTEGIAAQLLGNWTTNILWNWHTGHPLTVTMDASGNTLGYVPDGNGGVAGSLRPDLVPGVSVVPSDQNSANWVNQAAFTTPPYDPQTGALLRVGNAGNGLVRSPNAWQVDFSVEKGIRFKERYTFQLGAQIFNIFNHVQLADPNTLTFTYGCTPDPTKFPGPYTCSISPNSNFGVINTFVNKNFNSDKFFADNTGSGLPRQVQFYFRFQF